MERFITGLNVTNGLEWTRLHSISLLATVFFLFRGDFEALEAVHKDLLSVTDAEWLVHRTELPPLNPVWFGVLEGESAETEACLGYTVPAEPEALYRFGRENMERKIAYLACEQLPPLPTVSPPPMTSPDLFARIALAYGHLEVA